MSSWIKRIKQFVSDNYHQLQEVFIVVFLSSYLIVESYNKQQAYEQAIQEIIKVNNRLAKDNIELRKLINDVRAELNTPFYVKIIETIFKIEI